MDAGSLDELADDLASQHVLDDDAFDLFGIDPIIQSRGATRAGKRRKPKADGLLRGELSHQDVGALRATTETALPDQIGTLAGAMGFERRAKHLVECAGSSTIPALGASTDHDLVATRQHSERDRVTLELSIDRSLVSYIADRMYEKQSRDRG